jgi:16S rRNA G966 N2-methylase RsmD
MSLAPANPLCRSITPAKQTARRHYGSHPYFTKRAWNVVQEYVRHFSAPGDTVLDPFGGSGVTAVESLILRRKAIYVDISPWACFLARQTAHAPVDLGALRSALAQVEGRCRRYLEELWQTPENELAERRVGDWYPRDVHLPTNADVQRVEELFTPRMLHGLARLHASIMGVADTFSRDLLRLAFSATLVRINRTFLSATNRRESRGGSAIFSIYRYKVAKRAVELPLWEQFATRCKRLFQAKLETNQLIGDFYQESDTATFRQGSATRLQSWIEPGSIDYIYTDPPYGGHIAYLDLSTMWAAWLGFDISAADRAEEVIEGGDLRKTSDDYHQLLAVSVQQMYETLKRGGWMSIVFAHRDTRYWKGLVDACQDAGFHYVNTVAQPVGVVWSMHKKKNPLRVLSGELVLNFRKEAHSVPAPRTMTGPDATSIVRTCCEAEIVRGAGASTEALHHAVIPKLLESGLLASFSKQHGDLTPMLGKWFEFDAMAGRWQLRDGDELFADLSTKALGRYLVMTLLVRLDREGRPPTEAQVLRHVRTRLRNGRSLSKNTVRTLLHQVGYSPDKCHWRPGGQNGQQEFLFK